MKTPPSEDELKKEIKRLGNINSYDLGFKEGKLQKEQEIIEKIENRIYKINTRCGCSICQDRINQLQELLSEFKQKSGGFER